MDEWGKNRPMRPDAGVARRGTRDRDGKRSDPGQRRDRLDDALERGLEDTFPGSDPVSVIQPPSSIYDKNEAKRGARSSVRPPVSAISP
jgi:hypothetical protein